MVRKLVHFSTFLNQFHGLSRHILKSRINARFFLIRIVKLIQFLRQQHWGTVSAGLQGSTQYYSSLIFLKKKKLFPSTFTADAVKQSIFKIEI